VNIKVSANVDCILITWEYIEILTFYIYCHCRGYIVYRYILYWARRTGKVYMIGTLTLYVPNDGRATKPKFHFSFSVSLCRFVCADAVIALLLNGLPLI
jgi:hypothetical protein